jgi:hypothetical protein
MVNRYEIRGADPDGNEGQLLVALGQQMRVNWEEVVFYPTRATRDRCPPSKPASGSTCLPGTTSERCSSSTPTS